MDRMPYNRVCLKVSQFCIRLTPLPSFCKDDDLRTLFLIMFKEELEIFVKSVPRMMGDLAIAQRPKCARSSAALRPPLPISYIAGYFVRCRTGNKASTLADGPDNQGAGLGVG